MSKAKRKSGPPGAYPGEGEVMKTEKIERAITALEDIARVDQAESLQHIADIARTELFVLKEAAKALVGLTPGGSEYVDDPVRCVAFIRRKEEGLSKAMKRFKDRADKARQEAIEKPIKQLQKCADWLMSAQGYLPWDSEIGAKFKAVEDETRALIKQLEQT